MSCPRLHWSELLVQWGTNEFCSYPEPVPWLQAWFFLWIVNCMRLFIWRITKCKERSSSKSPSLSCCSSCSARIDEKVCVLLVSSVFETLLLQMPAYVFYDCLWSQQLTIRIENKSAKYVSVLPVAVTRNNFVSQLSLNLRLIAVAEVWPLSGQVG